MRARIFAGGSWVGGVLGSGVGVEEEGEVEVCRVRERSGSLRRAMVVRDMAALGTGGFRTPGPGVLEVD
jgi:hypothetical protein